MKRAICSRLDFASGGVSGISRRLLVGFFAAAVAARSGGGELPKAARSVHLRYDAKDGDLFYNELTVEQSTSGSYFMACGWNTGYFGIQQLDASTNKVVIFSVWDPTRGDNANKVPLEERVQILYQDPAARISRFGGEGTGGKCIWPCSWRTNETYGFIVSAAIDGEFTSYAGWFRDGRAGDWQHLVTFRTRTGGQLLSGLYSFIEDFRRDGHSVKETRRARFGNGWLRAANTQWVPLNRAVFTASNAEWESKENIDAGLSGSAFYLATGGKIVRTRELNQGIELPRNSSGKPPGLPDALNE